MEGLRLSLYSRDNQKHLISTEEQLEDLYCGVKISYLCNKFGMINIYTPT